MIMSSTSIAKDTAADSVKPAFSRTSRHIPTPSILNSLEVLGVPLSKSSLPDCAVCDDPCSAPMDMEGYPSSFSIDTTTPLLGHVKPFDYLVLCSSGKSDWPHDVCQDPDSVPGALRRTYPKPPPPEKSVSDKPSAAVLKPKLPGVFPLPRHVTSDQSVDEIDSLRVTILSSSHFSNSATSEGHSLIVLPDWVRLTDVTHSTIPRFPLSPNVKTRLPHRAIILICSHKTRDKRCSISAPILQEALTNSLEELGQEWKIDTRGDEEIDSDSEENWIGIFRVSHSGGHKFAGNVIVNFSSGISIWYGRVTPADCQRIVQETIVGRKVIPELLKGGVGLSGHDASGLKW